MISSQQKLPTHPLFQVAEVELHYKHKVNQSDRPKIGYSRQAYELLMQVYNPMTIDHHESFYVMALSQASKVLGVCKISDGGIAGTVVDARMIFQVALKLNASSLILSHNHPSGNLMPSDSDKKITRTIADGCRVLDLQLKDHIIVTTEGYFSFADDGLI